MKKIIIFFLFVVLLAGCSKNDAKSHINQINDKIETSKSYQLVADLEIYRNEDLFSYSVISTYEKEGKFKVELTNKENNHKQVILKNGEFVYVLTPALNKSFKFQSDWPYNNSQIYLLQPIFLDLKKDENLIFENKEDYLIFTSAVNYSNEKDLKKQKVYIKENNDISKIEVLNGNDEIKMLLNVISVEYNIKLSDNFFDPNQYKGNLEEKNKEAFNELPDLEEFLYPMYVPAETYLTSQDVIETENGDRIILSFSGASNFVFIQDASHQNDQEKYIYGDPYLIFDTIGAVTDKSVSWVSGGVEYSVVSDTLSVDELVMVAQSIGVRPVGK